MTEVLLPNAAPVPDTDAAIQFLKQFAPKGPWVLTAIRPDRKGVTTDTFRPETEDRMRCWLEQYNGQRNLYFQVNPPINNLSKKASKEDVQSLAWLHVDIDPRAGEDLANEQERIWTLLTESRPDGVPEPTCVIFSGGGYQAFWRLEVPFPIDGDLERAAEAERYNKQLETLFSADSCHNVDRIMRLPGTVNLPDERKRKKGRKAVLAELIEFNDNVYPLCKFTAAPMTQIGKDLGIGGVAVQSSEKVKRVADLAELDQWKVPDRVKVIIAQGRHPDEPNKRDDSRSAWLYDAVCQLVRCKVPDNVIEGIITDQSWAISAHVLEQAKPEQYARRQIAQAHACIESEPPILHNDEPLLSAREFRSRHRPTLMHYNDDWLAYDGSAYRDLEENTVRSELYEFLDRALTPAKEMPQPFKPTKVKVGNVLDALMGVAHVPRDIYVPPCWLKGDGLPPRELLACRNGLLHLPTGDLLPPTPRFFTRNALDFDYDPSAKPPERWYRFLGELWGEGDEIGALQEIMGYLLVPDTSQQKIFLLVGPRRSGKGTIGRVLRSLVGKHNTAGPTLGSRARDFGLATLIDKQLAIVSDMRLGKMSDRAAITENLLRISGEDVITADRKYKNAWTGQLSARFIIMTNELPNLPDDSGALASRLVPLIMHESFLGREDPALLAGLLEELPGILCWALEGWRQLRERGHFLLPEASRETIDEVHTLGSPAAAFLRDRCVFDVEAATPKNAVWEEWSSWCQGRGMYIGDQRHFGVKFIAAGEGRITSKKAGRDGYRVPSYAGLRLLAGDEAPEQEEISF